MAAAAVLAVASTMNPPTAATGATELGNWPRASCRSAKKACHDSGVGKGPDIVSG